jgi:hypothetical protein
VIIGSDKDYPRNHFEIKSYIGSRQNLTSTIWTCHCAQMSPDDFPSIDEFRRDSIPSQFSALSSFHLFASTSNDFSYESLLVLSNGLKAILCRYLGHDSLILPLFHGYPSNSDNLPELLNLAGDRSAILALCAADSSVILYALSDFEFPADA